MNEASDNVQEIAVSDGLRVSLRDNPAVRGVTWGQEVVFRMQKAWLGEATARKEAALLSHNLLTMTFPSTKAFRAAVTETTNKFWDIVNGLVRQRNYLHDSWRAAELDVIKYRNLIWKAEYITALNRRRATHSEKRRRDAEHELAIVGKELEKARETLNDMGNTLERAKKEITWLRMELESVSAEAVRANNRAAAMQGPAESGGVSLDWRRHIRDNAHAMRDNAVAHRWKSNESDADDKQ